MPFTGDTASPPEPLRNYFKPDFFNTIGATSTLRQHQAKVCYRLPERSINRPR
jgi:hypothetical protein